LFRPSITGHREPGPALLESRTEEEPFTVRPHAGTSSLPQVCNCVLAIGQTRMALEPAGLDIRARPEFIKVHKNGSDLSGIKFAIHVESIA
jgi:hypothetical protein